MADRIPPGDYWCKLKGSLHRSASRWELDLDSIGLWTLCMSWAADHLSDGFVPEAFVKANLPRPDRRGALPKLIVNGYVHEVPGGYQLCDYLDHNQRREEILHIKEIRAKSGAKGGAAKANAVANARASATANAVANGQQISSRVKKEEVEAKASTNVGDRSEVVFLCNLLAEKIVANDPKAKPQPDSRGWRVACRLLIESDGRTPTEIQQAIEWATRHDFWRANVLSMPTLRKQFGRLWLQMPTGQRAPQVGADAESRAAAEAVRVKGPLEQAAGW